MASRSAISQNTAILFGVLVIIGIFGGIFISNPSSGTSVQPERIYNYKPGSSYNVGYDFYGLNVTDRSIACYVNFSVASFGWFTTGARVGSINVTVFSSN